MDKLAMVIIGAGEVGWEKLSFMFRHAQDVHITVVAPEIKEEIEILVKEFPDRLTLIQKKFSPEDLDACDLAIAATADKALNRSVWEQAKQKGVLINVADTPSLCDFYLSSVVKKGDLKIAISSNGKSPTLTKRIRELLEDVLPEEIDDILQNLKEIRDQLKGDFEYKVQKLDEITSTFQERNNKTN